MCISQLFHLCQTLILTERFTCRGDEAVDAASLTKVVKTDESEQTGSKEAAPVEAEVVQYKKLEIMKKGNKTSFPRKGDMGMLFFT